VTLRFEARVEGDTWYHIGEVGDYKLREIWERVDPKKVRSELGSGATLEDGTLNSESQ
jgi:hypothetical protein